MDVQPSRPVLGYMPTKRRFFSGDDAKLYKEKIRKKLGELIPEIKIVDLEGINEHGLLNSLEDVAKAVARFRAEGVDALFVPHCNFGCEEAVCVAAQRLNLPLLLWAPRDEAPLANGERLRDSQCGLFATSKVLQRFGVKFSYVVNSRVEDPLFAEGLRNFLGAANAVKHFRNARIGQVSTRPKDFYSVICNEGELLERFGIQTVPMDLGKITAAAKAKVQNPTGELKDLAALMKTRADFSLVSADSALKMAALMQTLEEWKKEEQLEAAALQCWDELQLEFGICPCFVNSLLIERGFPVACETDVHGALSMLLQQAATQYTQPVFLSDLTIRHPEDDNSELLWHCGAFPPSLADGKKALNKHFVLPGNPDGVCNWKVRDGHLTISRFDGVRGKYSFFTGECDTTPGPFNQGTYVYMKVPNWPEWEEKFIYGPYIHHVSCMYGSYKNAMKEAVRYIDGLEFDPA